MKCMGDDAEVVLGVPNLFHKINFYLIGNVDPMIERMLLDGGGHKYQYLSDILTHCIAECSDEEVVEAKELFQLTVVKSCWIKLSVKCNILLPTKPFDADVKNVLSNIVICPSQLSRHDHLLAWGLVTTHGGRYISTLNQSVTHLLTNTCSGSKYTKASSVGMHIVCMQWLVHVVQENKLFQELDYHPSLFQCTPQDQTFNYNNVTNNVNNDANNSITNNSGNNINNENNNVYNAPNKTPLSQVETNTSSSSLAVPMEVSIYDDACFKPSPPSSQLKKVSLKSCDWLPTSHGDQLHADIYHTHEHPNIVGPNSCFVGCCFFIEDYKNKLTECEFNLWRQVIEQYQGRVVDEYSDDVTHVLCETQDSLHFKEPLKDGRRLVTSYWLNDCLLKQKLMVPSNSLHLPHMKPVEMLCTNQMISITNFDGYERVVVKRMVTMLGARYTGHLSRNNSILVAKRASGRKYQKALEWNVPVVNARWLSELLFGNLKAFKQPLLPRFTSFVDDDPLSLPHHLVSHLLESWKAPIKLQQEHLLMKLLPVDGDVKMRKRRSEASIEDEPSHKLKNMTVNVVITGYPKNYVDYLTKEVERMGGQLVSMGVQCTHLVAPRILRTIKFLACVSHAKFVITSQWIESCISASRFVDANKFALKDVEMESKFNFDFQKNLQNRTASKLFQGVTMYITTNTSPPVTFLKELAQCSGAHVLNDLPSDGAYQGTPLVIITCQKDLHMFTDASNKQNLYSSEFILNSIIKQQIDFSSFKIS